MTAPSAPGRPALDREVEQIAADRGRTWGVLDAALGVLAVPAALAVTVLLLTVLPGVPGASAAVVGTVVLGAATVLAARRAVRQSGGARRALGLDLPRLSDLGRVVVWSLLLLLAQMVVVVLLSTLVPALRGVRAENVGFLRDEPLVSVLAVAVAAVVVAPVLEELLFRGLVLRGLMLRWGFWPAALVSSVFFGLFHAQGSGGQAVLLAVATGVFGLGLCLLVRRTGRLGPAVGVHALRNALAITAVLLT